MEKIVARRATPEDLEAVAQLRENTDRDAILVAIGRSACWLAQNDTELLGYGLVEKFFGRPFVSLVWVAEAYRRVGVGSSLMESIELAFAGKRVFTSTNISNRSMQALLSSRGYELSGYVQDLDKGDPELIFSKPVAPVPT